MIQGPSYKEQDIFDLERMEPYTLSTMYEVFSRVTKEIVLYLPRTSNLNQVEAVAMERDQIPVIDYAMNGWSKGICAFYGEFGHPRDI
jgi:trimethylguanosine synthase